MKKLFRSALMVSGLLVAMSSCKDKEAAGTPLENSKSTATIEGFVTFDSDDTDDDDFNNDEPAAGAPMLLTTYSDIEGDDDAIIKTVSVGADGRFSISVPTISSGAEVQIKLSDFKGTKKFTFFDDGKEKTETEPGFYQGGTTVFSGTVFPGEVKKIGEKTYGTFIPTNLHSNYND